MDTTFILTKPRIDFHIRNKKVRAIPVNKYFVVTAGYEGYKLYNRVLKIPLIEREFESAKLAYQFGKTLELIYGDYLDILIDDTWSKHFFVVTRYSIKSGMRMFAGMSRLMDEDTLITQDVLEEAFNNVNPR
jgi:hypothetical protein